MSRSDRCAEGLVLPHVSGSRALSALLVSFLALAGYVGCTPAAAPVPPAPHGTTPPLTPSPTPSPGTAALVTHVIIIIQENRTPDNLFQGLPGADIATSGVNASGQTVQLSPIPLKIPWDISHTHAAYMAAYDGGKMDGFEYAPYNCADPPCSTIHTAYGYVPTSETQPYQQLAAAYTFADRMFQSNSGPSMPAHQYLLSGTSEIATGSAYNAAGNPEYAAGDTGNCGGNPKSVVSAINVSDGSIIGVKPCFDHKTMFDLLDAAGVSYKYYQSISNWLWDAPSAIEHIFDGPDYASHVTTSDTQIITDIGHNALPAVSWVIPTAAASDHAGASNGSGPSWVASVVNAVGDNPQYWAHTVIFITWDDWGGWYDHVPPPQYNYLELGSRVPLIIVSPYARRGYVSHQQHEFGSILHYIEERFNLPSLDFTDARADDFSDCFDYTQSAKSFRAISAPLGAKYFESLPFSNAPVDTDN